ncbi:MAG: hypothetical protein J7K20_02045 [Thermodesulfobacterium sp.]|nr:hypothetical protein [Thermodesulfobacterium sp.]
MYIRRGHNPKRLQVVEEGMEYLIQEHEKGTIFSYKELGRGHRWNNHWLPLNFYFVARGFIRKLKEVR